MHSEASFFRFMMTFHNNENNDGDVDKDDEATNNYALSESEMDKGAVKKGIRHRAGKWTLSLTLFFVFVQHYNHI